MLKIHSVTQSPLTNGQKEVKSAWISGICVIIAAIIGVFSININMENDKLKANNRTIEFENNKLKEENNDLRNAYTELDGKIDELVIKNNSLSKEIAALKESSEQNTYSNPDSTEDTALIPTIENNSLDTGLVTVPGVVGLSQEEAISVLENANLNFMVWTNENDIGDTYYVIDQSIPANSMVAIGTTIKLQLVSY